MPRGNSGRLPDGIDRSRVDAVQARLGTVRERIRIAGGDPARITIVSVTKYRSAEDVVAAIAAGITEFGENYPAEMAAKAGAVVAMMERGGVRDSLRGAPVPGVEGLVLPPGGESGECGSDALQPAHVGPRWHMIGTIQRRQVRRVARIVWCWQSVARLVEGEEIARHSPPGTNVLIQVNAVEMAGRNGCGMSAVEGLAVSLERLGLNVRGLMAMGAGTDVQRTRRAFSSVASLAIRCGFPEISLGMSDDLEIAVQEGSTMVRIGTALFGERPAIHPPESPDG